MSSVHLTAHKQSVSKVVVQVCSGDWGGPTQTNTAKDPFTAVWREQKKRVCRVKRWGFGWQDKAQQRAVQGGEY
jgi:hypothetical protein